MLEETGGPNGICSLHCNMCEQTISAPTIPPLSFSHTYPQCTLLFFQHYMKDPNPSGIYHANILLPTRQGDKELLGMGPKKQGSWGQVFGRAVKILPSVLQCLHLSAALAPDPSLLLINTPGGSR